MRLTVNLDEDLYLEARSVSIAEGCSISAAINKLLRRQPFPPARPSRPSKKSFPVSRGRKKFTSEDVYKIEQL